MAKKHVEVIEETSSGRNKKFRDNKKGKVMNLPKFVNEIESGNYPEFHVRTINGIKTPVSKPDGNKENNLG